MVGIRSRVAFFAAFGVFIFGGLETALGANIEWSVENRFRFYKSADVFKTYAKAAMEIHRNPANRSSWIQKTERSLQDADIAKNKFNAKGWAAASLDQTCWDRTSWSYTNCGKERDYVLPKSHDVVLTASGVQQPASASCTWMVAKSPTGEPPTDIAQATVFKKASCDESVKYAVAYSPERSRPETFVYLVVESAGERSIAGPTPVLVRDILVVGMGDSFGAGVGNPDRPVRLDRNNHFHYDGVAVGGRIPVRQGARSGGRTSDRRFADAQAEWLDMRCFRSQYSYQFRSALHLAVLLKHAAVTFLDVACDGARIIEGMLHRKPIKDGFGTRAQDNPPPPQIGSVSVLLCKARVQSSQVRYRVLYRNDYSRVGDVCSDPAKRTLCDFGNVKYASDGKTLRSGPTTMEVCPGDGSHDGPWLRKIDLVLLSIGGNDIGFAPMVAHVLIGSGLYEKYAKGKAWSHGSKEGLERLALLLNKYRKLDHAMFSHLPIRNDDRSRVILTAYPMAVSGEANGSGSSICDGQDAQAGMDAEPIFRSFAPRETDPDRRPQSTPVNRLDEGPRDLRDVLRVTCLLNLTRVHWTAYSSDGDRASNEKAVRGGVCSEVKDKYENEVDRKHDRALGWTYVAEFLPAFEGRGFCARGNEGAADRQLEMPYKVPRDLKWSVYDISEFRAYGPTRRWVRTPNDAFLVTNWHSGGPIGSRDNRLIAMSTSAMHLNAEGYAVMADRVLAAALHRLCQDKGSGVEAEAACK